jgi:nucleotide-binding universal stress UspA family protein
MITFERILCSTDLSEASVPSLKYASALARRYGAHVTVLHVVPSFEPMTVPAAGFMYPMQVVSPMSRDEVLREMHKLVAGAGVEATNTTFVAEAGDPARMIVEQSLAAATDLVVMGTHGRSGFERLLIGSVAEKVLRKAPCPLLLVPPHAAVGTSADVTFRNILCPLDFSPSALQALGFALELAREGKATVRVLYAVELLPEEELRTNAHFNVPEYRQHVVEDALGRLNTLLAGESRSSIAVEPMVAVGRAYREILRVAADAPTDLIVMGAQGRGGLGLTLFGSTTQQVVRAATCPVLTVRGPHDG